MSEPVIFHRADKIDLHRLMFHAATSAAFLADLFADHPEFKQAYIKAYGTHGFECLALAVNLLLGEPAKQVLGDIKE